MVPSVPLLLAGLLAVYALNVAAVTFQPTQGASMYSLANAWAPNLPFGWSGSSTSEFKSECARWDGVTCDASGNVVSIYITGYFLNATIPGEPFAGLTALQTLSLQYSNLFGSLPSQLANLPSLSTMSLVGNQLSGSIPSCLTNLTRLYLLNLGENRFEGTIPDFSSLEDLQLLDLHGNNLYGSMPYSLAYIPRLNFLDVSSNQLSGYPVDTFASSQMGSYSTAVYNIRDNYFSGSTSDFGFTGGAENPWLCPSYCDSDLVRYYLTDFFLTSLGSDATNCFRQLSSEDEPMCGPVPQRSASECNAFCGVFQSGGPCGGNGTCYLAGPSKVPTCKCNPGFYPVTATDGGVTYPTCSDVANPPPPPPPTSAPPPPPVNPAYVKPGLSRTIDVTYAVTTLSHYNKYFRHVSANFQTGSTSPAWTYSRSVDWSKASAVSTPQEQKGCASCWAFVATGAAESAYAIQYGLPPPLMSAQQVLSCQGTWDCSGGLPSDALEYMAAISKGVASNALLPYKAAVDTAVCSGFGSLQTPQGRSLRAARSSWLQQWVTKWRNAKCRRNKRRCKVPPAPPAPPPPSPPTAKSPPNPPYGVQMFEQVSIDGWLGMVLAVQIQPVIGFITASWPTFTEYTGGFVYADSDCFSSGVIDHSVVVVGYSLDATVPYWLIKNSWGTGWGEGGFMRMALTLGDGTCGINTTPAVYPVVKGPNPCGPINPCGGGTCTSSTSNPGGYTCTCQTGFVSVANIDSSHTCSPLDACAFAGAGACGAGTCINDGVGSFNCLCPEGFVLNATATGKITCIPGTTTNGQPIYPGMTCDTVTSTFFISQSDLLEGNPGLNCSNMQAFGSAVYVGTPPACYATYKPQAEETCYDVESRFNIVGLSGLNPQINCEDFIKSARVCVKQGNSSYDVCTRYFSPTANDTCNTARDFARPPLSTIDFFALNPNIDCGAPLIGTQVCIRGGPSITTLYGAAQCSTRRYYTVTRGDACSTIIAKKYRGSVALFQSLNSGFVCQNPKLYVGLKLCAP